MTAFLWFTAVCAGFCLLAILFSGNTSESSKDDKSNEPEAKEEEDEHVDEYEALGITDSEFWPMAGCVTGYTITVAVAVLAAMGIIYAIGDVIHEFVTTFAGK